MYRISWLIVFIIQAATNAVSASTALQARGTWKKHFTTGSVPAISERVAFAYFIPGSTGNNKSTISTLSTITSIFSVARFTNIDILALTIAPLVPPVEAILRKMVKHFLLHCMNYYYFFLILYDMVLVCNSTEYKCCAS